jgi:transmembrane 9 superfamily protein 2/4
MNKLHIKSGVPTLLYFGWMFIGCFAFFVLTGSIGFFATRMFVTKIYGSIKVD